MWQFLKMTWMFFWRLGLANTIWFMGLSVWWVLVISAGAAAVLRWGGKISLNIFPLIHLMLGKSALTYYRDQRRGHQAAPVPYPVETLQHPTARGATSLFEPQKLEQVADPIPAQFPTMFGAPGQNLASARNMSAYHKKSGMLGERNFAKVLSMVHADDGAPFLATVYSFWSVPMPSAQNITIPDTVFQTDIDCIILSGNTLLLIDVKMYRGGDVTYQSSGNTLYCIDNPTGKLVGEPRHMTKNMALARDRFQKHFPSMRVIPLVVFMPTDVGAPVVGDVMWPGEIPALGLESTMTYLGQTLPRQNPPAMELRKMVSAAT